MEKHKKYEEYARSNHKILITIAFVSIGVCFTMMITMLTRLPSLTPVNVVDYNYSQISKFEIYEEYYAPDNSEDSHEGSPVSNQENNNEVSHEVSHEVSSETSSEDSHIQSAQDTVSHTKTASQIAESYEFPSAYEQNRNTPIININSANLLQLMQLNGIGEVKAQAIIDYREKIGRFTAIEQIMEVKGIGEKTFEKIKDKITV